MRVATRITMRGAMRVSARFAKRGIVRGAMRVARRYTKRGVTVRNAMRVVGFLEGATKLSFLSVVITSQGFVQGEGATRDASIFTRREFHRFHKVHKARARRAVTRFLRGFLRGFTREEFRKARALEEGVGFLSVRRVDRIVIEEVQARASDLGAGDAGTRRRRTIGRVASRISIAA